MPVTHLVVTRPPLPDGLAPAAAPLLGLGVYEAKLFLKYPLPDVVRVCDGADAAEREASAFRAAELPVDVVPVAALLALPPPQPALAFDLGGDALALKFKEGGLLVPWEALRVLVLSQYEVEPRARASSGVPEEMAKRFKKAGDRAGDALGGVAGELVGGVLSGLGDDLSAPAAGRSVYRYQMADLAVREGDGLRRIRLDQPVLDFTGLGDRMKSVGVENWRALLAELRARAPRMAADEALVKTRPRQTMVQGRTLESYLTEEPEAVRGLVGVYPEFYSALLAWRAGQAGTEDAVAATAAAAPGVGAVPASAAGPGRPAAVPAPIPRPASVAADPVAAFRREAAIANVRAGAERGRRARRAATIDMTLLALAVPIMIVSILLVVLIQVFVLKFSSIAKTVVGRNRAPVWMFGGFVALAMSFSLQEHWGDAQRPFIVRTIFPILLVSAASGLTLLLRRKLRGGA